MRNTLLLLGLLGLIAAAFSCGGQSGGAGAGSDTPTEAYKRLYAAVKTKDIEAIKQQLTVKTVDLGKLSMQRYGKTEQQAYENGFTASTFADSLPSIRDERIKDNYGAIEVWNSKDSKWEDLPFMIEEGKWKLALGEAFGGSFKSPGKARDLIEKEAANAMQGNAVPMQGPPMLNANVAGNANGK
ncbi:MAG TPA: hypothetical protein VGO43_10510 [Pyrinomonadaceae bacterium]|jgi:hypothetical protein|nr:hypothetical protein [Pyrinomonadaceae bacterium]